MHFARETRPAVADGTVTMTVRLWSRPQVKVGGRYETAGVTIEVDDMELVPFSGVSAADVRRCGEQDRESLRRRTAHAGPVTDDTLVYRIEFHIVD
jgi:hypothetical protein